MNLQEKLRFNIGKLRTSKLPLSDMIPLMQEAADKLDALEYQLKAKEQGIDLKQVPALFKPKE